ncbi:MAG: lipopolysaccharide biosynthesis protein [Anaerolineae bacterium]|nr:lipopolysaccharide biosynthesis protein [Anaerolineae bacterium]
MIWKGVQMVSIKLIFLARTIILARLLAPEDFGLLAISLVAVEFLMVITNIGMVPALVQHPESEEAHYNAAWTAGMVRALFVTTAVFLSAPLIANLFHEPRAVPLIQAAALRPTLESAASIKMAQLTRNLDFRALTLARLPDALVNTVLSIILAPLLGVWALIIGSLAGPLVYTGMSYWLAPHRPRFTFDWAAIRPLIRFGRWIFLTGIIVMAGRAAMQMIISRQLGVTELGLYFLAAKLAFLPAEVSSEVINSVAFPLYATLQDNLHQLARAFRAILVAMLALILPVCVLLFALTPSLVTYVLGPKWNDTVELIRVLLLVNIVGLLGTTIVPILNGTGRPYRVAVIECLQSGLLLLLTGPLVARFGVMGAALVWLPAVGASQLVSVVYARLILPHPFQGIGRPTVAISLVTITGGLIAAGITMLWPGVVGLLVAGGTAVIVMAVLLWQADLALQLGLQANLTLAFPPLARLKILNYKP